MLLSRRMQLGAAGVKDFPMAEYQGEEYLSGAGPTVNHTSFDIGPAFPNRMIAVAASGYSATSRTLTAATINGVSATIALTTSAQVIGGIFYAMVPTGTSVTISTTYSGTITSSSIGVWAVDAGKIASTTPTDTATDGGTILIGLTGADGGFAIATNAGSETNDVWGGDVTELYDSGAAYIASFAEDLTADTSVSITLSQTQGRTYAASWA